MRGAPGWTDEQVELVLGLLLRVGVLVAATVVLIGGVLYVVYYGSSAPGYEIFHGEPSDLRSVSGIITDALALSRRGIVQLGLILLIATPIARVIFSVVAFVLQRDWTYVIVTLMVLAVLLYSLSGGGL